MTQINETNLARVYRHIEDNRPFAILTGFRDSDNEGNELSIVQNRQRNSAIEAVLKQLNYGYTKVKGGYVELDKDGNRIEVEEESFIVFGEFGKSSELRDVVTKLGALYDQDSIFFRDDKGVAVIISTRADSSLGGVGSELNVGTFKPKQLSAYFTKLKNGKKFTFEGILAEYDAKRRLGFAGAAGVALSRSNFIEKSNEGLLETNLSRLHKHITDNRPIVILTGFRDRDEFDSPIPLSVNRENNAKIEQILRKFNYGYTRVNGAYVETTVNGESVEVTEESFIVFGEYGHGEEIKSLAIKLGVRFYQDTILYRDQRGKAVLIGTRPNSFAGPNIGDVKELGDFQVINDVQTFYTKLKNGRKFAFKSVGEGFNPKHLSVQTRYSRHVALKEFLKDTNHNQEDIERPRTLAERLKFDYGLTIGNEHYIQFINKGRIVKAIVVIPQKGHPAVTIKSSFQGIPTLTVIRVVDDKLITQGTNTRPYAIEEFVRQTVGESDIKITIQ